MFKGIGKVLKSMRCEHEWRRRFAGYVITRTSVEYLYECKKCRVQAPENVARYTPYGKVRLKNVTSIHGLG